MKAIAKKLLLACLSIFLAASALSAFQPTPKVLTQAKLDRFLADMEKVMADPAVSAAWQSGVQAASMDAVMNPNSELGNLNSLEAVYAIWSGARDKAKVDADANAALRRMGWTSEYWDVFVVMSMGIHCATVISFNKEAAAQGVGSGPTDELLPQVEKFMHKDDFALIQANYQRIFDLVGQEISQQNGF